LQSHTATFFPIEPELGKLLWLGGSKTWLHETDHEPRLRACVRKLKTIATIILLGAPQRTIEFVFDFIAVVLELSRTPIDLSRAHFDLTNLDLLWWILGMIQTGRFRSVCCEPSCTIFSPAQYPASTVWLPIRSCYNV